MKQTDTNMKNSYMTEFLLKSFCNYFFFKFRSTWVAQQVKRQTSARVMISRFVSSSPVSSSVLTAQKMKNE